MGIMEKKMGTTANSFRPMLALSFNTDCACLSSYCYSLTTLAATTRD